jgi:chromosome segregation ATPase
MAKTPPQPRKADEAAKRADRESARADSLVKRKEEWLADLNRQLAEVKASIAAANDNLRVDDIRGSETNRDVRDQNALNTESHSELLQRLEAKEDALQNQINYFMANYH